MEDLITFSSSMLPSTARVLGFRGVEALSRPYRFEIFLSLPSDGEDDVNFAEVVGAKARLTIDRQDEKSPPFLFAGVLGSVDLVHEFDGRALLRVVLVPRLWELTLSRHSRIFTKKSVPEVIQAVLEDNGLGGADYALHLNGSYETEEHISQYRESDFDFLSRWMEREGIFYYFEHTEDGEKLVLSDDKAYPAEALGAPVRYYPQLEQDRVARPSFRTFAAQHGAMPSQIKLKDYDYNRPSFALAGQAPVSPNGAGEISLYGERFFTADAGKRLAKLRAEEYLAREAVYQATGTRMHLRTGYTFELEDHPRARFNTKYLAMELRHHGNQAPDSKYFQEIVGLEHKEVYLAEVTAIPATTQFRAESRTAWPRIYGYENGTVDGAALSEYAQIDEHGRYLIKFKFDEGSGREGGASTYVRMMQPHGGGVEGFHFPLRKGTEVVMSFLGGDPDRPVISGVVPNVLTPSAVTAGNFTKNVIQTGGRNRLELEDMAGAQRVTLSTPYSNTYLRMGSPNDGHELIAKTDDNGLIQTGVNLDVTVGDNWTNAVTSNITTTSAGGDITTSAASGNITDMASLNITTTSLGGDITTTAAGGKIAMVANTDLTGDAQTGKIALTAQTTADLIAKSGKITIDAQDNELLVHAKGKLTIKSDATREDIITQDMTITRNANLTTTTHGNVTTVIAGKTVDRKAGMFITAQGGVVMDLKGNASLAFTAGLTADFKLSAAYEFAFGVKFSQAISGEIAHTFGFKITDSNGVALDIKNGVSVTATGGSRRQCSPPHWRPWGSPPCSPRARTPHHRPAPRRR